MKGNTKKLAVLVSISVLLLFAIAVMASASEKGKGRHALWGQYAVTGGGACFSGEFNPSDWTATNPALTMFSPDVIEGVYTFYRDGTGVFDGTARVLIIAPGGAPQFGGSQDLHWDFNYTVTKEGEIEFFNYVGTATWTSGPSFLVTSPPCSSTGDNGPSHGLISQDRHNLSVTCGPDPERNIIINNKDCNGQPAGQLLCIVSLVGHLL